MILYVDESENEKYFIVTGLLMKSERYTNDLYHSFKKKITSYKMSNIYKAKMYTEFKSIILDSRFQSIKKRMLNIIASSNGKIFYSVYLKRTEHISQSIKEDVYIYLLEKIVSSIDEEVDVIFDKFNMNKFETRIIKVISFFSNVDSIIPGDSQLVPGLQFVDNLCSVIRLKISNQDNNNFYMIISNIIKKV